MKTFFTEVDSKSDKSHLREINQLLLRLNLESPRTQLAMKELNLTKYDCQLKQNSAQIIIQELCPISYITVKEKHFLNVIQFSISIFIFFIKGFLDL